MSSNIILYSEYYNKKPLFTEVSFSIFSLIYYVNNKYLPFILNK